MRKSRAKNTIVFSVIALMTLAVGILATYYMLFNPIIISNTLDAVSTDTFNVTVSTASAPSSYQNSNGVSYNSPYETSKSQLSVQFYDNDTGALVATHMFDNIWGTSTTYATTGVTYNFGSSLTQGKEYKVCVICPTFMRYEVTYTANTDMTNSPTNTSTFMVYYGGAQSLLIDILGIEDNSWITLYS